MKAPRLAHHLLSGTIVIWVAVLALHASTASADSILTIHANGTGAYPTIQAAIDAAAPGTIIELADGIYRGSGNRDLDFRGKPITVRSESGDPEACIIDCGGSEAEPHMGLYFHSNEGEESILAGVTIRNGYAQLGGGIRCQNSAPTISNCILTENYAITTGGGICLHETSNATIEHCRFLDNTAGTTGGGASSSYSWPVFTYCTFSGNYAEISGGAIKASRGTPPFGPWPNRKDIEDAQMTPEFVHVPRFINCTIVDNTAGKDGGAFVFIFQSADIENTVVAYNKGEPLIKRNGFSFPALRHCNLYGNEGRDWSGSIGNQRGINGNFSKPPLFCDHAALAGNSPCAPANSPMGSLIGAWPVGCADMSPPESPDADPLGDAAVLDEETIAQRMRLWKHREEQHTLWCQAMLHEIRGDYQCATEYMRAHMALCRKIYDPGSRYLWKSTRVLAGLLLRLGNHAEAIKYQRESLEMTRQGFGPRSEESVFAMISLAEALLTDGQEQEAELLLQTAITIGIVEGESDSYPITSALSDMGYIAMRQGRFDDAADYFRKALDGRERLLRETHTDLARSRIVLARSLTAQGAFDEAIELFEKGLAARINRFGANHGVISETLCQIADCYLCAGQANRAESLYVEAARIYEGARLNVGEGLSRSISLSSPYLNLATVEYLLGATEEIWPALEKAQGRALADLLMEESQKTLRPEDAKHQEELLGKTNQLQSRISAFEKKLAADSSNTAIAGDLTDARTRLLEAQVELHRFQTTIAQEYPIERGQILSLERIQATLPENGAIVGWLDFHLFHDVKACAGYIIRPHGPVIWVDLDADASVHPSTFRDSLIVGRMGRHDETRLDDINTMGHSIWAAWIAPLLPHLEDVDALVIIPAGAMLGIPIEALTDEHGTTLNDRFAVSYSASATLFAWLQEQEASRKRMVAERALLVGDPPFKPAHLAAMEHALDANENADPGEYFWVNSQEDSTAESVFSASFLRSALSGNSEALSSLPRLHWTGREVRSAEMMFPEATVLLNEDASEAELLKLAEADELAQYQMIHLATHALVSDDDPERSALVLSQVDLPDPLETINRGERVIDGLLTAREIVQEFELNAELVTLSACQTALGCEIPGEGYVGLTQAFLQAGARSVLVSLWRVEDEATARLMNRFYGNLTGHRTGAPMPKNAALQEAKQYLRIYREPDGTYPFAHPSCWSGFILLGAPD